MYISIDNLLRYERYIPVMTDEEQEALLSSRPSAAKVKEWRKRQDKQASRIGDIFRRAYQRQKENGKSK